MSEMGSFTSIPRCRKESGSPPRTDIRRQRLKDEAQRLVEQIARLPELVRIAKGID